MSPGRLAFLAALAAAVVFPVRAFVVEPIYIASPSMEPTLKSGVHVFLDKLTYRLRDPRDGEVIVFRSPVGEEHDSVKRVIGAPGDVVELKEKKVLRNGAELFEDYVQHTRAAEKLKGDTLGPLKVPPDGYFVLGDNRDESRDSSVWTDEKGRPLYFIRRQAVVGKVRGFF